MYICVHIHIRPPTHTYAPTHIHTHAHTYICVCIVRCEELTKRVTFSPRRDFGAPQFFNHQIFKIMQISDFLTSKQLDALKRIAVRKHDASRYASIDGRVINRVYELAAKTHTTISAYVLKRINYGTMVFFFNNHVQIETIKFYDENYAKHVARFVKMGAIGLMVCNTITLSQDVNKSTLKEVYRTINPERLPDNPEALDTPTRSELAQRRRNRKRESMFREGAKCIRKRGLGRAGYILSARDKEQRRWEEAIVSVDSAVYSGASQILECAYSE